MQKDDYSNKLLVGYFTPSQKSKSYKFKEPSSYHEAFKYKTNLKDERIISYLESIDARKMCQTSPDDVLELCITKINSLAQNDFEKVKLIHDAIWYLTDVCWDCSHFKDGVRDDFYSTDYLFNKPVFFITSHFPMFKELQLLKPAINKDFSGYYVYPQQQQ